MVLLRGDASVTRQPQVEEIDFIPPRGFLTQSRAEETRARKHRMEFQISESPFFRTGTCVSPGSPPIKEEKPEYVSGEV